MNKLNYEHVFNVLVEKTAKYVTSNNRKAMILGISGGIDSTVVAAICHEVSKNTGIPLIGRSLPIKNKNDEFDVSKLAGEAFCDDFQVRNLRLSYKAALMDAIDTISNVSQNLHSGELMCDYKVDELEKWKGRTPIANGNLQARCRMQHLYDLAGRHNGLVMSTDNQTEYQLGFWTRHGDEGDYDPVQDLWKTEVYGLANWLMMYYFNSDQNDKYIAITSSIALTPTDGLGISNSDLEQIGAKSYAEVDDILQTMFTAISKSGSEWIDAVFYVDLCKKYSQEVVDKVWNRHLASEFKRMKSPIYIPRSDYEKG